MEDKNYYHIKTTLNGQALPVRVINRDIYPYAMEMVIICVKDAIDGLLEASTGHIAVFECAGECRNIILDIKKSDNDKISIEGPIESTDIYSEAVMYYLDKKSKKVKRKEAHEIR